MKCQAQSGCQIEADWVVEDLELSTKILTCQEHVAQCLLEGGEVICIFRVTCMGSHALEVLKELQNKEKNDDSLTQSKSGGSNRQDYDTRVEDPSSGKKGVGRVVVPGGEDLVGRASGKLESNAP